jgi:hypothetical protein
MPNLSLTEQEKIEAFCRELAQSLRQITGSQVTVSEEEFASLAQQVTAKPSASESNDAPSSPAIVSPDSTGTGNRTLPKSSPKKQRQHSR